VHPAVASAFNIHTGQMRELNRNYNNLHYVVMQQVLPPHPLSVLNALC
jgi:hypothetical protein